LESFSIQFYKSDNSLEAKSLTSGSEITEHLSPTTFFITLPATIANKYDGTGFVYSKV